VRYAGAVREPDVYRLPAGSRVDDAVERAGGPTARAEPQGLNLAARLMAKAQPGRIYATADVLDRSNTLFDTAALEPFLVKGKAKPVEAWDVGKAVGSRTRHGTLLALPLTGRDAEIATLREALTAARSGSGHVFELVGEAGVGKSRLASALREEATDFHRLHAVCEAYTASTPYAVWQERADFEKRAERVNAE